jgi:hypothetical protein
VHAGGPLSDNALASLSVLRSQADRSAFGHDGPMAHRRRRPPESPRSRLPPRAKGYKSAIRAKSRLKREPGTLALVRKCTVYHVQLPGTHTTTQALP